MSGTEEARWDRFLMQKKLMRWCCGKRSRRGWGGSVGAECNTQDANCLRPLTFAQTCGGPNSIQSLLYKTEALLKLV